MELQCIILDIRVYYAHTVMYIALVCGVKYNVIPFRHIVIPNYRNEQNQLITRPEGKLIRGGASYVCLGPRVFLLYRRHYRNAYCNRAV